MARHKSRDCQPNTMPNNYESNMDFDTAIDAILYEF